MLTKQTYLCFGNKFRSCMLLLMLICASYFANAQLSSRIYRTKVLYDTLIANNNRDFLYNNVTITNLTSDSISIFLTITMPKGWLLTTQKVLTVSLPPNQNTIVNLRMLPSKSTTANWETVKLEYRLNKGVEKITDTFRVKVQEFMKFKGRLPMPSIVLGAYQKDITFPVFVKNSGNTPKNYTIKYYNQLLNLNYKQKIHLEPSHDTTYKIPLRLTEAQWSLLRKEEIKVQVTVEDGETINLMQELSKIGSVLKEYPSAYQDMPLQVETGMTAQGKDDIQYYGALHGRLDLANRDRVSFDVRSKTFARGQVLDNDIYRVEYDGQKWYGSAGNVMQLTDFVMDGYGLQFGKKWRQQTSRAGIYALLKSRSGDSKLFGGDVAFWVKDNIKLTESAAANFDAANKINSYLVKQKIEVKFNDDMEGAILMGAGIEQATQQLLNSKKTSQAGTSIGYSFLWNHKHINVTSNVLFNSNSYPGVFKGQRSQSHDVRGIYKNVFVGGFYEFNLRKQNIYVDTQLFSDVFNLKTESYGARVGLSIKRLNLTFSAGNQIQQQSESATDPIYLYSFVNLNTSLMIGSRSYISLNSYLGEGRLKGFEDTTKVTVMSNQGSLQIYFGGVSARYDIGPYFYHEYIRYLKKPEDYNRVVLGPYIDLNLFKNSLTFRSQYNYNKSVPAATETSNMLGNLVYHNYRRGFDFNLTGIVPINQKDVEPYVSASLRVRLHVPFLPIRKYYQLKLVLFKDENTDGKRNPGEGPVIGQMLALNDNLFISDEEGTVMFKNVAKRDFKADFGYTSKIKGWIPQGGTIQTFPVTGNKTIYIPYKKSKVLVGKLQLKLDKNSNLDFDLGNIKVTATGNDTLRASYSTLTDANGEFYFNLPAGKYTITLSELAFDDKFKPVEFAKQADLINNDTKTIYFEIKQKRRAINIKRKKKK